MELLDHLFQIAASVEQLDEIRRDFTVCTTEQGQQVLPTEEFKVNPGVISVIRCDDHFRHILTKGLLMMALLGGGTCLFRLDRYFWIACQIRVVSSRLYSDLSRENT